MSIHAPFDAAPGPSGPNALDLAQPARAAILANDWAFSIICSPSERWRRDGRGQILHRTGDRFCTVCLGKIRTIAPVFAGLVFGNHLIPPFVVGPQVATTFDESSAGAWHLGERFRTLKIKRRRSRYFASSAYATATTPPTDIPYATCHAAESCHSVGIIRPRDWQFRNRARGSGWDPFYFRPGRRICVAALLVAVAKD